MEAQEGETVTLACEYSLPGVQFHWRKGFESIRPGDKYVLKQRKTIILLTIKALSPEDSGVYTCQCRQHHTSASLKVHGKLFYSHTFGFITFYYKTKDIMQIFKLCVHVQNTNTFTIQYLKNYS